MQEYVFRGWVEVRHGDIIASVAPNTDTGWTVFLYRSYADYLDGYDSGTVEMATKSSALEVARNYVQGIRVF